MLPRLDDAESAPWVEHQQLLDQMPCRGGDVFPIFCSEMLIANATTNLRTAPATDNGDRKA